MIEINEKKERKKISFTFILSLQISLMLAQHPFSVQKPSQDLHISSIIGRMYWIWWSSPIYDRDEPIFFLKKEKQTSSKMHMDLSIRQQTLTRA